MVRQCFLKRRMRIRYKVKRYANTLRLTLHKSNRHIYAQIIDDSIGKVCVFVSTLDKNISNNVRNVNLCNKVNAEKLSCLLLSKLGSINRVYFDRSGYKYHGIVKVFVSSIRKVLNF